MNRSGTLLLIVTLMYPIHSGAEEVSLAVTDRDVVYGVPETPEAEHQTLDVYYRTQRTGLPVVIYVHGGGWAFGDKEDVNAKPSFFVKQNIVFISMNYRLRWDYQIYDQVEDIVSVVQWVDDNAETYGMDPDKIVLMGHAAGAHLVSLAATNPSFMKAAGKSLRDLTAVVSIDTASYDIKRLMVELGSFIERRQHRLIFGNEEEVWAEASPITHVQEQQAVPSFAVLYVASDEARTLQAKGFARELSAAGVETIMIPSNDRSSDEIDEALGTRGDGTTQALMAFLRAKI